MNVCSLSKSDLTRIRLLDAVERLVTEEGPSAVTMRAVAAGTECSVGLAYRYFATKQLLLGAVLDRAAAYITADLESLQSFDQIARQTWQRMSERPVFAKLVTSMALEGEDFTAVMQGHPFLQVIARNAQNAGDPDPVSTAAAIGVLILAGDVFAPGINRAVGREPKDDAIQERLIAVMQRIQTSDPQTLRSQSTKEKRE